MRLVFGCIAVLLIGAFYGLLIGAGVEWIAHVLRANGVKGL